MPELRFRILLAGDAEVREKYIELRTLHEAFHCHQRSETTHTLSQGSVLCLPTTMSDT
jgi:hypothetical protein